MRPMPKWLSTVVSRMVLYLADKVCALQFAQYGQVFFRIHHVIPVYIVSEMDVSGNQEVSIVIL